MKGLRNGGVRGGESAIVELSVSERMDTWSCVEAIVYLNDRNSCLVRESRIDRDLSFFKSWISVKRSRMGRTAQESGLVTSAHCCRDSESNLC